MRRRKLVLTGSAVVAAAAMLLSACGDDDDGDDVGTAAQAPTGPPISLGFINTENSPAGTYPGTREGAEAAVEYINAELGGVNGRPLDLESCITNGSGESSIGCANKFVQQGKLAVIPGLDFGADSSVPILQAAGIPYVGGLPVTSTELTSPTSFAFIGSSPGATAAIARYIGEDLKPAKVAILTADLPSTKLAIDTFIKPVLAQFGVTDVVTVAESPTAVDYTPALTRANEGDPDVIFTIFAGQPCSSIMRGSASLGIDPAKMIYIQTCFAREQLEAGGAGAEGARSNTPFALPGSDDEDVQIYEKAMKSYAPKSVIGPDSQGGFNSVMNIFALLKTLPAEAVTPADLLAAIKATRDQPNFMAHPYTCDGAQVPGLSAPCNTNEHIIRYEGGTVEYAKDDWVNGAALLKQGGA